MAGDVLEGIAPAQGTGQARQRPVLGVFVRHIVGSLKLDPDRRKIPDGLDEAPSAADKHAQA